LILFLQGFANLQEISSAHVEALVTGLSSFNHDSIFDKEVSGAHHGCKQVKTTCHFDNGTVSLHSKCSYPEIPVLY
jgi:hypothetical protein